MAERQERFHSVVDLLDAFFGGSWTGESVNQLSRDEMYSLAEDVNSFYSEFRLPHRGDQEYRCYSGGATFSQSGPPASTNQPTAVGPIPLSSIPIFARSAVLYADEIVVNCPLDAWVYRYRDFRMPGPYWSYHRTMAITSLHTFGEYQPGFWGAEEAENRLRLSRALASLDQWSEAIRQGWLLPIPHLRYWRRREESIWAQVRRDALSPKFHGLLQEQFEENFAVADNVRGLDVVPNEGWHPQDAPRAQSEPISLYNNAMLAIAAETDARFLPTADSDYAFLQHKANVAVALDRELRDALTVDALSHVWLPGLEEEDVRLICAIRRDEESFAAWRDGIRSLISGSFLPSSMPVRECRRLTKETIDEYVSGIRGAITRSRSLSGRLASARPQAIDFAYAVVMFAVPGEILIKALAGVSVPILKAALSAFSPQVAGGNSVVLALDRARWRVEDGASTTA